MAISIVDKHLVVTSTYKGVGYEGARMRIKALLNLLSSVTDSDRLMPEDVYYVCEMIEELLPSEEEFNTIAKL